MLTLRRLLAVCFASVLVTTGAMTVVAVVAVAGPKPGVRVTASPAQVEVGEPTTVTVKVVPVSKGRPVVLERKDGARWVKLASGRTNARGVVTLRVSFTAPGRVPLRAVAKKHRGQKKRTGTTSVLVVSRGGGGGGEPDPGPQEPPPGGDEDPFPTAGGLTLQAPRWVLVGSTFDLRFPVTAGPGGVASATLVVTPPAEGQRVTPPGDLTPVPGGLGVTITGLPATESTTPRLRWKAPDRPGRLEVTATLAVGGVQRQLAGTIQVVPEPGGGQVFTGGLEIWRESREAPVDPDLVTDLPGRVLGPRAVPAFEVALSEARAFVAARFDGTQQASWQEFLDRTAADPELVDDVLATAFGSNHSVAALAIALRGHQVAPNDPVHLSNAAVAANSLDHPEWAIAFGREAGRLPAGPSVGAQQDAVRLTNIAHAWALMGSWANAEQQLRRALLVDPQNPLIHEELAAVKQFAGGKTAALPHIRRSLRKTDDKDPLEDHESNAPYRFSRVSAGDIFDLSKGLDGRIVMPDFPETPGELMA
ncbi:hypothetical protein, partial [Nocardioides sp.]|uniref:tetratricopeptide repeat protein n=1 Tax=Nocardioides sp. TaxID=35761 RepID=UPI001A1CC224